MFSFEDLVSHTLSTKPAPRYVFSVCTVSAYESSPIRVTSQSYAVDESHEMMGRQIEGAWDGVPRELGGSAVGNERAVTVN